MLFLLGLNASGQLCAPGSLFSTRAGLRASLVPRRAGWMRSSTGLGCGLVLSRFGTWKAPTSGLVGSIGWRVSLGFCVRELIQNAAVHAEVLEDEKVKSPTLSPGAPEARVVSHLHCPAWARTV